jgi:hypothetical protein
MTQHFYMREGGTLPSLESQQASARAAGFTALDPDVDRAYLDKPRRRKADGPDFTQRDLAIRACRPGDELWVAAVRVLGGTTLDCLDALRLITERGAVLRIAETGEAFTWAPGAESALALAQRAEAETRANRTTRATAGAISRHERARAAEKRAWDRALVMWKDLRFTVAQITAETKIRPRTLYNAVERGDFPPRNAQPFTSGPKVKRRGR